MRWRAAAVVAIAIALLGGRQAAAERSYSVRIESDPDGARILIDDPDGDPVGETPWNGELEPGTYTVILELDGYETAIESLTVKKVRKKQRLRVELNKKPTAYVKLRPADIGEDFSSSTILIDDIERSVEVDEKIELGVGAHKLEVVREGYETYVAYFELEEGQLQAITVNFVPAGSKPVARVDPDDPLGGGKVKKSKREAGPSAPASVSLVSLWGGFEWGGRDFKYAAGATRLRDYSFLGARFRVGGAVHPLRSQGRWLAGVGLGFTTGFLIGPRTSTNDNGTPADLSDDLSATNGWFDYRVDLRYRLDFADKYWAAGAVGYGQDRFSFSNADANLADDLAGVDYQSLSFGLMGGARLGKADLHAGFNLYQVRQAGDVQMRFTSASIAAFGLSVGGMIPIYGRLELAGRLFYDRYSYTFGPPPSGADYIADGATDQFFGLTLGLGFRY